MPDVGRVLFFGFGLACVVVAGMWFSRFPRDRQKVMSAPRLVRLWAFGIPATFAISGGLLMAAALVPAYSWPLVIAAAGVWLLRGIGMRLTAARMLEEASTLDR